MLSEVVTRVQDLAKISGLTINPDGGLYEITGVSRNSIEYADNDVTEMIRLAFEATGVDAETTGLTTETTGVAVDAQVDSEVEEVMDIDVDTMDTTSVNSSTDTEREDTEEIEGNNDLESPELATELDTAVTQQLTNTSDDMDIRDGARSG
jgi:hypothetical protein